MPIHSNSNSQFGPEPNEPDREIKDSPSEFREQFFGQPANLLPSENPVSQFPSQPPVRDPVHTPAVPAATPTAAKLPPRRGHRSDSLGSIMWLLASAALVVGVWRVGPLIVEEYQYALTAGEVRAEYDHAFENLKDSSLSDVSHAYQLVAHRIRPSVVSIQTKRVDSPGTRGQGSGVVMSKEGFIITNAHVVMDVTEISVALYDRHRYRAELIGLDLDSDLAVLKIDADNLIPAQWGDSDSLSVGSIVWAIGSPFGLDQTVTSGIISGKNRQDEDHQNRELLQTDAAVNPGNSGGPLVDAAGNVIGINTSIFGERFQGISFAVPSTTAQFVYKQLIEKGKVTRGYLGVRPMPVYQDVAKRMNLESLNGAWLQTVESWSPAHAGGLKPNDIIVEWNGQPLTLHSTLFRYVEMTKPNESVNVKLVRDGKEHELNITVGDRENYSRRR